MQLSIPLDKMTISEKLLALEQIWDDLQRSSKDVPSPSWHEDVLRARQARAQEGTSHFGDWSDAKHGIRDRAR